MPPKRKASSRARGFKPEQFESIDSFSRILEFASCSAAHSFADILADEINNIREIIANGQENGSASTIDHSYVANAICGPAEEHIASVLAMKSSLMQKSGTSIIKSEAQSSFSAETLMQSATPPITAETTDEEMEDLQIPHTALRMQQMSIGRNLATPTRQATNTPKRTVQREDLRSPSRHFRANNAKPHLVFDAPSEMESAHSKKNQESEKELELAQKAEHAAELKKRFLQEKVAKAKDMDEKRKAVKERKERLEKERLESLEEKRKRELKAAEFVKNSNLLKSPTRKVMPPRTPLSKLNTALSNTEGTPGRRPAKFGRIDAAENGRTTAKATVDVSPSRNLPRREKVAALKPERKIAKPSNLKKPAKTSSKVDSVDATAKLLAEQEAYLMKVTEEKARREAEEQRMLKEQEDARRKEEAEAHRRMEEEEREKREQQTREEEEERREQQAREEEAEMLRKMQEEQQEKLRKEREMEEIALKAAEEKRAAADKKKLVTAYEMTPPRVYVAKSKTDYGLDDLNSDDETDQEDDPRKEVPAWADFNLVRREARVHWSKPPFHIEEFFGEFPMPNLKLIFGEQVRIKKRGSSAVWKSPISNSVAVSCGLRDIEE